MTEKSRTSASSDVTDPPQKKTGGGTAIGGGVNFQAAVTAIVGVHIMRGIPLNWLEGLCPDVPTAVWAESEGPGDDLRIEFAKSEAIEVQVKKGLQRGDGLWNALMSLAKAIHADKLSHGVLVVGVDSSTAIREELSVDIERLGEGRREHLRDIGKEWLDRLNKAEIPVTEICRNLRIKVIHARSEDDVTITFAKHLLREVCAREADVDAAWNYLYRQAVRSIEKRGRWVLPDLVRHFRSAGIAIREADFPSSNYDRYSKWVICNNEFFYLTGIRSKFPLTELLPMHLERMEDTLTTAKDAASALEHYHKSPQDVRFSDNFDAEWIGRFKRLAVVVAGPGLGKSTLLRQLAYRYAEDGYWVFSASLKRIATATKNGNAFIDSFWKHALDSSPVVFSQIDSQPRQSFVLLLDGLDECGDEQNYVAEHIRKFATSYPAVRVIVTTRPIGYDTLELREGWTHYRLLAPRKEDGAKNLEKLMFSIRGVEAKVDGNDANSNEPFEQSRPSEAIAISPLLLGLCASLIHHRRTLPGTRIALYKQLLLQFDKHPANDAKANADTYATVLDIAGWTLLKNPLIFFEELVATVADVLAPKLQTLPLTARTVVRDALSLWEKVGLVEQVHFDGQALLTFIHKTFCEFTAARFLVRHPKYLVEVIDRADSQEVIDFAAGQGFADYMIEFFLSRHADGQVGQLQSAIALLGKSDIVVSAERSSMLVDAAFRSIHENVNEKFSIGVALFELAMRAKQFVALKAEENLASENLAVKLVAWAIAVSGNEDSYSAATLSRILLELRSVVASSKLTTSLMKPDRSDRDLYEVIALAALNAHPDECIRDFAERELREDGLYSWMFSLKVDSVLKVRGIEPLRADFQDPAKTKPTVTLTPIGPTGSELIESGYRAIAKAFAQGDKPIEAAVKKTSSLVHFAGFIRASGLLDVPVPDFYNWLEAHDEAASQATLKVVASLTAIDLHMLEADAGELLLRLQTGVNKHVFDMLPAVDIDEPDWSIVTSISFNIEDVMRGLVHSSSWINFMALQICRHYEIPLPTLSELLKAAQGFSIRCVYYLLSESGTDDAFKILTDRLFADSSGDVSTIFSLLLDEGRKPTDQLVATTLACLRSTHEETAKAAAECLSRWVDEGVAVDRETIAAALAYRVGADGMNTLVVTPAYVLNEILEKLKLRDGT